MSLIAENQTVMGIRSLGERGLGTVTGHRGVRHVKGPFQYGVTGDNVNISAQECTFAIILLDAVRNLKWNAGRGEDVIASYPAGNAFVIPPHETIQFSWPLPVEYIYFPVSNRNKASHASEENATGADAIPSKIIRFSSKQCLQVSQILWEELQSENSEDHFLQALHLVLTNVVIRNAVMAYDTGGVQPGLSPYACRQIEAYLQENFRGPVSVPDMAAMLGISAGHFATCFRESFGQTPHRYLLKLRLDEAERCLRETDMPISEIAARLNFSSQSHLTTALRKYRRLTPGKIRQAGASKSRY